MVLPYIDNTVITPAQVHHNIPYLQHCNGSAYASTIPFLPFPNLHPDMQQYLSPKLSPKHQPITISTGCMDTPATAVQLLRTIFPLLYIPL